MAYSHCAETGQGQVQEMGSGPRKRNQYPFFPIVLVQFPVHVLVMFLYSVNKPLLGIRASYSYGELCGFEKYPVWRISICTCLVAKDDQTSVYVLWTMTLKATLTCNLVLWVFVLWRRTFSSRSAMFPFL